MYDENELSLIRNKKEIINDYKSDNLVKGVYMIPEDDEEESL